MFKESMVLKLAVYFNKIYKESAIAALIAVIRLSYSNSVLKRVYEAYMQKSWPLEGSLYWRILYRFNLFMHELGIRLKPHIDGSIFVRAGKGFVKSGFVSGGFIDRLIFAPGMKRFLIALFALYLPVDYFLRSIGALSFLASAWDDAFLVFGLIYAAARLMQSKLPMQPRVSPLDLPILLFLAVGFFLMCVNAPDFSIAVNGYRATAQYILWFFVIYRLLEDEGDVLTFAAIFVFLGTLTALHGLYQFIMAVPIPSGWVSATEAGVRTRVFSIFGSPNIMGSFMIMTAPIAAAYAYKVKNVILKVFFWGCVGIICFSCLVTFSRGAWIGMAAAVFVFAAYRDRRLIGLMLAAVCAAMFVPDIQNRITYLFTSDFAEASLRAGRSGRWAAGFDLLIKNNPWLGFGQGRFGGAVAMQNQVIEGLSYFYMDNYYLKTLVEMGYIGFAFYMILIVCLVITGMRSVFRRKLKNADINLSCGILAAIFGVLVHCFFENIFEVPYMNAYFWGLAAMLIFLGKKQDKIEV